MPKSKWVPLDLASLPNCRFIACDPSLRATGLVLVEVHEGQVTIVEAQTVGTEQTDKLGWEDTFLRTHQLRDKLRPIITGWVEDYGSTYLDAVHEAPPVGGGMMRTESSILAGREFEDVCYELMLPQAPLVTANAHKYLICGNGRAGKTEHGNAVKALLPEILDGKLITNEPKRDALSVGLYAADRKKENWNGRRK